ncbi:Unknown protein sequence [Pseudomonas savastanoi pv. phaseolicola]|uniref:Uncharacterized protein n=2 Tax=Pseudomonas savastanoi TaxID=29438 RepID=A0A3M3FW82_PSESG|nr:Unknown protein sequence [Pseudomonas savastanoi pv. phaseolicola]RMM65252.1 hypothetical protein ALQ74_04141 [Pseudomonas savastanoi pv. glycinea]KPB51075.1 Unknown protein sequence [Pseudomonas savastanoi pv. phaseolicola]KPB54038.1 Unknown protein sequence [Pseudomonas savastanoi pv. phaseolicola]KPY20780.1 hypothetical protein ALO55_101240 [Pseudomonas savastanoi pv. phaseolicola]
MIPEFILGFASSKSYRRILVGPKYFDYMACVIQPTYCKYDWRVRGGSQILVMLLAKSPTLQITACSFDWWPMAIRL